MLFLFSHADANWPHSVYYEGDAPEWVRWAQALQRGQPYEFDLPMRSPGVAYAMHWLGADDPERKSFVTAKVLWCVMSAATCALAYLGLAMVFPRRVVLIAGGLSVYFFGSYVTATSLNNETPYALCLFASIMLTLRMVQRPSFLIAIALALLHGLAMLLRAEHPLFLLAMTGWLAWHLRSMVPSPVTRRNVLMQMAIILVGAVFVCLPWSVRGALAIHRFNTVQAETIDFTNVRLPNAPADYPPVKWTPEAQAAVNQLPAFARVPNIYQLTLMVLQQRRTEVTPDDVHRLFTEHFYYTPEPLKSWTLLSIKGPLDFALANHPDAAGGFAKNAMVTAGEPNPVLHLALPEHLYLLNHGYRAGWQSIISNPGKWLANVARKLAIFSDGITLGYTAENIPIGPYGQRRAIDLMTAESGRFLWWKALVLGLFGCGVVRAIGQRHGGLWLVIIACKIIVTILFYGYARQAVSVFPAFALFIALPIDRIVSWIEGRVRFTIRTRWAFAFVIMGALLLADVMAWWFPKGTSVSGPVVSTPQWGERAFECTDPILIKPPSPAKPPKLTSADMLWHGHQTHVIERPVQRPAGEGSR